MTPSPSRHPFSLLLLSTLLALAPLAAQAGSVGISDEGGFFSEAAKADATANIREVQRTLKKDIRIETFPQIPDALRQGVNLQDKAALARLYNDWAVQQARQQAVNGVYILLVKEPPHLQAVVGNETQKQAFTLGDRETLVRTMIARLRAKDYDGALREATAFIATTMRNHAGQQPGAVAPSAAGRSSASSSSGSSGFSLGSILPLVIFGLIAWFAIGFIRSLFGGGNRGNYGQGMDAQGNPIGGAGGGGFGRSLLGGLFGAAAGMWMYDSFFGSSAHGASHTGLDPNANPMGGPPPLPDANPFGSSTDTDYSSSGSDFGGGSSFSDFGGGGGSDFGGGGGDFGGGGGDF